MGKNILKLPRVQMFPTSIFLPRVPAGTSQGAQLGSFRGLIRVMYQSLKRREYEVAFRQYVRICTC